MIHSTYIDLVSENAPSDNDDEDQRLTEKKAVDTIPVGLSCETRYGSLNCK
jgi:hypothetical protein